MADIPVKKYRLRKARKWLQHRLTPFRVRAGRVAAQWKKPDRKKFPPRSLAALEKLGREKGVFLVGCDSTGTNAFFLRDDVRIEGITALTARKAFRPSANWLQRGISEAEQIEFMQSMPYEEV